MKNRVYTRAFKEKAVRLSHNPSTTIRQLAIDLGIKPARLYAWRRLMTRSICRLCAAVTRSTEIRLLRKQAQKQQLQIEILQKRQQKVLYTNAQKYQFMFDHRHLYSIEQMSKALQTSRTSYYRWYNGLPRKQTLDNIKLTKLIKHIFKKSKQRYGSRRIAAWLCQQGHVTSRSRVAKLMLQNKLRSKRTPAFRNYKQDLSNTIIKPNLLNQNFKAKRLNEIWVSDLTYIYTQEGWLYLTTIMDLYNREIIGYSTSSNFRTQKTLLPAWNQAISKRTKVLPLIFHSDRGVQYTSGRFQDLLTNYPLIRQSMSRKGNCWDNAVAESFFKTLKSEIGYDKIFYTYEVAKTVIQEFIEDWYNKERLHSSLGYVSPRNYISSSISKLIAFE